MKITVKREQSQTSLGMSSRSNLRDTGAKMSKTLFKSISIFVMTLSIFTSCVKEMELEASRSNDSNMVTFSITAPGPTVVSARATAGTTAENRISNITVFVFDKATDKLVRFFTPTLTAVTAGATNGNKYTFNATFENRELNRKAHTVLAIANTAVTGYALGESMATVKGKLAASGVVSTTAGTKWDPAAIIPMWGETDNVNLNPSMSSIDITMVRMLARVNVNVTAANFTLDNVAYYNYNTAGKVIPDATSFAGGVYTGAYQTPSLPASPGKQSTALSGYTVTGSKNCTNQIYIFENARGTAFSHATANTEWKNNPCLVIGGKYNGSTTTTYYRLDFVKKSTNTWLDILRNHSYVFNITSVGAPGYATAAEALDAAPVNIEVDVLPWNDAGGDVVYNGQYMLGVTPVFELDARARGYTAAITTDWPGAPAFVISTDATNPSAGTVGWLKNVEIGSATATNAATGQKTYPLTFDVDANLSRTDSRTAYIHITAGRLTFVVKVVQNIECTVYVGMFGGELSKNGNVYQYERRLYVQCADEVEGTPWTTFSSGAPVPITSDWNGRGNTWDLRSEDFPVPNKCFVMNNPTTANAAAMTWYLPAQAQLTGVWVAYNNFASATWFTPFDRTTNVTYLTSSIYGGTGLAGSASGLTFLHGQVLPVSTSATIHKARCVRDTD